MEAMIPWLLAIKSNLMYFDLQLLPFHSAPATPAPVVFFQVLSYTKLGAQRYTSGRVSALQS